MKIHGTAKGAALSTKHFGVAFGGAAAAFDDTDLKAYWKFSAASGDIPNSSESDESLGSGAALQVTGNGYQDGSPPIGNSMSFNGVDEDAVAGTSLTQFKYLHNGSLWTNVWWAKNGRDGGKFFGTISSNQEGLKVRIEASGSVEFAIYNGSGVNTVSGTNSSANFVPDSLNWYFYVFSWDYTLGSLNFKLRRDNGNQETKNKSGTVPSDGDSG